jgi:hypothetical protein
MFDFIKIKIPLKKNGRMIELKIIIEETEL